MSVRYVLRRFPHPTMLDLEVFAMDDGFPFVARANSVPDTWRVVYISGDSVHYGHVRSLGECIREPTCSEGGLVDQPRSVPLVFSDIFCGDTLANVNSGMTVATWDRYLKSFVAFESDGSFVPKERFTPKFAREVSMLEDFYAFVGCFCPPDTDKFVVAGVWNRVNQVYVPDYLAKRIANMMEIHYFEINS